MVQRYRMLLLELSVMQEVHQINTQLYKLAEADYEAAKAPPSEFLPKKKSFLEAGLHVRQKEMEVKKQREDILNFVNY